ncbi:RNA methyltransferase [Desulfobacterales bacterium HSG16]|nr:RNA methyltransferase [Desulfobacterales bacterium HSG16]
MSENSCLNNVTIVLVQPRFPENIGAAVRAGMNMDIKNVRVVAPENFDLDKIMKLATHVARDVVERIKVYQTLKEALEPFGYVAGATARTGGQRKAIADPGQAARKLVSVAEENRTAIVFGPEDRGLSNEDIRLCHMLVNIPTAGFSSLNLAQAVMVMCYEIFKTCHAREKISQTPRLATRHELDGMYDQVKDILVNINYINPENPDYWMHRLRHFFTRIELKAGEVSIVRGICRQIEWYAGKRFEDGRNTVDKKDENP